MSELADRLVAAVRTRTALDPQGSDLDEGSAYDIQEEVIRALGPDVVAAKLGLTSRAKQVQMDVSEPLYGWMVGGTEIMRGEPLLAGELIQPRVEPEIAFVTSAELSGPAVTAAQVLMSTAAVMPAIDVLDSRYAGYSFTLPDVIADNSSAGRFIVGDPVSPEGIDLRTVGCVFSKNGEMVATAAGAAIFGHPAEAVAWFIRKLSERGRALPAGTVVLAGALTAAFAAVPGDSYTVEIDRIGMLELAVR